MAEGGTLSRNESSSSIRSTRSTSSSESFCSISSSRSFWRLFISRFSRSVEFKPSVLFKCPNVYQGKRAMFVDFTVKTKENEIPCHRFVLNACSEYFETLFKSESIKCQERLVINENIKPKIIELIIKAFYTGSIVFSIENMFDMWNATHFLKVNFLVTKIESFIISNITNENMFTVYNLSKEIGSSNIVTYAVIDFIMENFHDVRKSDNFYQLEFEDFINCAFQDHLKLCTNCKIDCILTWCGIKNDDTPKDNGNNLQHLAELFEIVNLDDASQDLLNKLMNNPYVLADKMAIAIVNRHAAEHDQIMKSWQTRWNRSFRIRILPCPCNTQNIKSTPSNRTDDTKQCEKRFAGEILQRFNQENKREKFCDVIIVVDGTEFPCHKFVLCACSEFFENLLKTELVYLVSLKDHGVIVCAEDLRLILSYIYGKVKIFDKINIFGIWYAAKTLGIGDLVADCELFVPTIVSANNCHEIYHHAKVLQSYKIIKDIQVFIELNYVDVINSKTFTSLPYELILHLIIEDIMRPPDLQIEAILKWCDATNERCDENMENLQFLGSLISAANLTTVSRDCMKKLVRNEYIQENKEAIAAVNARVADLI